MSFPLNPINGQTTTTNNITYIYSGSNTAWTRVPTTLTLTTATGGGSGSGSTYTTSLTAPSNPKVGDIWYLQGSDVVYRYEYDGVSNNWIDFNGPTVSSSGATTFTGGTVANSVQIQGSLTVATNLVIGTSSYTTSTVGLVVATTDGLQLPVGTTAQRPANPGVGTIRYNTSGTLGLEIFMQSGTSSGWISFVAPVYSINYLIVAGGGSGGVQGGGGAGGLLTGVTPVTMGATYSIVVGGGGAGVGPSTVLGNNGSNSVAFGLTGLGGGGGGVFHNGGSITAPSGGSGGGGGGCDNGNPINPGGSGTPGQGNSGGNGSSLNTTNGAGGGGGSAYAGITASGSVAGTGGTGTLISIIGTSTYYAGGGGGGSNGGTVGAGGLGGGGAGGNNANGVSGTAYTGSGGGGWGGGSYISGQGGSGVVIVSYPGPSQRALGGTITSYVQNALTVWVHTFTTSSVFTA
jgi:hypothetical protein